MPGIAGIVYPNIFQVSDVMTTMLEALEHRDTSFSTYSGIKDSYTYKNIQLGACGTTCVSHEHHMVRVLLDGTITNAAELRLLIKERGHESEDLSIEQLLINAYTLFGVTFIDHVEGAFAIALLDMKKNHLYIFRDRIGKKPLYWSYHNGHLLFASELKSLLSTGIIPQTLADDALASYLFFGYIPQDMTPIRNINKLLPGYYLRYNLDGQLEIQRYWSYSSCFLQCPTNVQEYRGKIPAKIETSVASYMKETSSIGYSLLPSPSSDILLPFLEPYSGKKDITAHSLLFEKESSLEEKKIPAFKDISIEQTACSSAKQLLNNLPHILWHLDEPCSDISSLSLWFSFINASTNVDTMISPLGFHEVFGTHTRYSSSEYLPIMPRHWLSALPRACRSSLTSCMRFISEKHAYHFLRSSLTKPHEIDYLKSQSVFSPHELANLSPLLSRNFDASIFLQKFYHISNLPPDASTLMYLDIKTRLTDMRLMAHERFATACGLTLHTPFLEDALVKYVAPLPLEEKCRLPFLSMQEYSPTTAWKPFDITQHQKSLYSILRSPAMSRSFSSLEKGLLVEAGYLNPKRLHALIMRPKPSLRELQQLWSLYVLETWVQSFISKPITSPPEIITSTV
jgi:asparagine synthase (glutamine-hydrolysing)